MGQSRNVWLSLIYHILPELRTCPDSHVFLLYHTQITYQVCAAQAMAQFLPTHLAQMPGQDDGTAQETCIIKHPINTMFPRRQENRSYSPTGFVPPTIYISHEMPIAASLDFDISARWCASGG